MDYPVYKSSAYVFMEKAWQRGELIFEPIKPINWDEFMRRL